MASPFHRGGPAAGGPSRSRGLGGGTAYILHLPHPQLCRNEEEKQFPRRVVSFKYRNRRGRSVRNDCGFEAVGFAEHLSLPFRVRSFVRTNPRGRRSGEQRAMVPCSRALSSLIPLLVSNLTSLVAQVKESACQCRRRRLDPWVAKTPWRKKWQPTPVFLHSCLGDPVDRGTWWATVHGVAKSQTPLRD